MLLSLSLSHTQLTHTLSSYDNFKVNSFEHTSYIRVYSNYTTTRTLVASRRYSLQYSYIVTKQNPHRAQNLQTELAVCTATCTLGHTRISQEHKSIGNRTFCIWHMDKIKHALSVTDFR